MLSQVLGTAARLGLADLLRNGTGDLAELAGATGCDPGALRRLLRALESAGMVQRPPDGTDRYALTRSGAVLAADAPAPVAALADLFTSEAVWRPWGQLLHSVRTGQTAFEAEWGRRGSRAL